MALAIDVGQLCAVRADLQNAADSAALAGASAYFSNAGLVQNYPGMNTLVRGRADQFSELNESFAASGTLIEYDDVILGAHDFHNRNAPIDESGTPRYNAVQVTVRRAPDSLNGSVVFTFAKLLGIDEGSVSATGVAAIDDRFAGVRILEESNPNMIPFTVELQLHDQMIASGTDQFSYSDDSVSNLGDGVGEVNIYPWKANNGNGQSSNNSGAGNFGLLDFDVKTNKDLERQILTGLTPAEVESVMGTNAPVYYDDAGDPVTYTTPGEPGLRASLGDAVAERVGDVVGYFVHDTVSGTGSNTVYRNVGVRFGRIMEIQLTGSMNNKRLVIQPTAYTGASVIVSESAPSSGGLAGRIRLVH